MMSELPMVGDEFAGYRMRAVLGRGGMSVVYLAEHPRLKNAVALKLLAPALAEDDAFRERLIRESRLAASLNHPNVVPVYDTGEEDGVLFISMRHVDGPDLQQAVDKHGPFSVADALRILARLASALSFAHREGIVHRDLKPANVMVDRTGRVKLADFGIARAVTDTMSRDSILKTTGTLLYMSPQQLEGGLPKVSDDIYGLGATLYELLTSKPPFYTGDLPHQVRHRGRRLVTSATTGSRRRRGTADRRRSVGSTGKSGRCNN